MLFLPRWRRVRDKQKMEVTVPDENDVHPHHVPVQVIAGKDASRFLTVITSHPAPRAYPERIELSSTRVNGPPHSPEMLGVQITNVLACFCDLSSVGVTPHNRLRTGIHIHTYFVCHALVSFWKQSSL